MTHVNPVLRQDAFRGREDSGNEATPTWIAAADTNWNQAVDTDFRVRFVIQETANSTNPATVTPLVEFQVNSGGYAAVGTTTAVKYGAFTGATDDDATTQQLGSGSFVTGRLDSNGSVTTADIQNSETEYEYCLQIDGAQVSNGDTINIRVVDNTTALDQYGSTPAITAVASIEDDIASGSIAVSGFAISDLGSWVNLINTFEYADTLSGDPSSGSTGNFTVTGGSDHVLIAMVGYMNGGSYTADAEQTTLSYNGNAMTQVGFINDPGVNADTGITVFAIRVSSGQTGAFSWAAFESDGSTAAPLRGIVITAFECDNADVASDSSCVSQVATDNAVTQTVTANTTNGFIGGLVINRYDTGDTTPYTPASDSIEIYDGTTGGTGAFNDLTYCVVEADDRTTASTGYSMGGTVTATSVPLSAFVEIQLPGATEDSFNAGSFTISGIALTDTKIISDSFDAGSISIAGFALDDAPSTTDDFDAGSIAVSGFALSDLKILSDSFDVGSITVSGFALADAQTYEDDLDAGSIVVTGFGLSDVEIQNDSFDVGSIVVSGQALSDAQTFEDDFDAGSITVAGFALSDQKLYLDSFDAGSIVVSGFALDDAPSVTDAFDAGSLSVAGFAITDTKVYNDTLDLGSLTVSGFAMSDASGVTEDTFDAGSIAVSGFALSDTKIFADAFDAGSIVVAGFALSDAKIYSDDFAIGSLTVSGFAASDVKVYNDDLSSGTLAVAGNAFTDAKTFEDTLAAGSIAVSGFAVSDLKILSDSLDAGSFAVTGFAFTDQVSLNDTFDLGNIIITGAPISDAQSVVVDDLDAGSFSITGYGMIDALLAWREEAAPGGGPWTEESAGSGTWTEEAAASGSWTEEPGL